MAVEWEGLLPTRIKFDSPVVKGVVGADDKAVVNDVLRSLLLCPK